MHVIANPIQKDYVAQKVYSNTPMNSVFSSSLAIRTLTSVKSDFALTLEDSIHITLMS